MRIALLVASAAIASLSAVAQLQEFEGLTYAQYGSRELKLDLFKPAEQDKPLPAIVCIHGGDLKSRQEF